MTDPSEFAVLLNNVLHASYRLTNADLRNPRKTKTPAIQKRRAIDQLFRAVFGRPATAEENYIVGSTAVSYGGY